MFIILSSASKMHSNISSSFLGAGRSSGCEHGCITPFMSIYRLSNSTPFGLAPDKSTRKWINKDIWLYKEEIENGIPFRKVLKDDSSILSKKKSLLVRKILFLAKNLTWNCNSINFFLRFFNTIDDDRAASALEPSEKRWNAHFVNLNKTNWRKTGFSCSKHRTI